MFKYGPKTDLKGAPKEAPTALQVAQKEPQKGSRRAPKGPKINLEMDPAKFSKKGARHTPIFLLSQYKFQSFFDLGAPGSQGSWGPFWGPILGSLVYLFKCILGWTRAINWKDL